MASDQCTLSTLLNILSVLGQSNGGSSGLHAAGLPWPTDPGCCYAKVLQGLVIDQRPLSSPPAHKARDQVFRPPARTVTASLLGLQTPLTTDEKHGTRDSALTLLGGPEVITMGEVWKIVSCSTILDDAQDASTSVHDYNPGHVIPHGSKVWPSRESIKTALASHYFKLHPLTLQSSSIKPSHSHSTTSTENQQIRSLVFPPQS